MKCYGVIMAGGGGTRFWPLSRQEMPKQLINLSGKELLINETIDRLARIIGLDDIFVITNREQAQKTLEATNGRILPSHILVEPCARNTCACVGYAAMEIHRKYGDGLMVVLPADAYIKDVDTYIAKIRIATEVAEAQDKLITLGVTPTFPATGYGYIRFNGQDKRDAKSVIEFKEKPDAVTAAQYIEIGEYLWNCGVFIWRSSTILAKIREFAPDIATQLDELGKAMGKPAEDQVKNEIYPQIRKISIDYAVMEPSATNGDVVVVPGDFGWSDVGSWDMLHTMHKPDEKGNVLFGDVLALDTDNSVVYAKNKLVAALGVSNIVIVETEDAILVCSKEKAQSVRNIVDVLEKSARSELL